MTEPKTIVRQKSHVLREAWTLLDSESHQPIKAMDCAGEPILLYTDGVVAQLGAEAHLRIYDIDCYPVRIELV